MLVSVESLFRTSSDVMAIRIKPLAVRPWLRAKSSLASLSLHPPTKPARKRALRGLLGKETKALGPCQPDILPYPLCLFVPDIVLDSVQFHIQCSMERPNLEL